MDIELTTKIGADDLIETIADSICAQSIKTMCRSNGYNDEAFHFITELEKRFQDGELAYLLAEHFLRECIKCDRIETKEELESLFQEVEKELQ
jgi:hypothetical protein